MRRFKFGVVIFGLMFLLCACAGWRGAAVANYETGAKILKLYKDQGQKACDTKVITPEDCQKLKDGYNKARKPYILAGDALGAAIETKDAVQEKIWKEQYEKLISSYTDLLLKFIEVGYDLGIFVKERR